MRMRKNAFVTAFIVLALVAITTAATAATITSISPSSMSPGGNNSSVYVYGTDFRPGAQFSVSAGGMRIDATNEVAASNGTYIRGTLTIPLNATIGNYTVNARNQNETTISKANLFSVTNPSINATIAGIFPPSIPCTGYNGVVSITGSGFLPGTQVGFDYPGGLRYVATDVNVGSPTQLSCSLYVPAAAPNGNYTAFIQVPGSPPVSQGVLRKTPCVTTIDYLSPYYLYRGQSPTSPLVPNLVVHGTNFKPNAQVTIFFGGLTIDATGEKTDSTGTSISCFVNVPCYADMVSYTAIVTNPGEPAVYKQQACAVLATPYPDFSYFNPTVVTHGSGKYVDVYGTGFMPNSQVVLYHTGWPLIYAYSVNVLSPTHINCYIYIPGDRPTGWMAAWVQNPCMGYQSKGFAMYVN